MEGIEARSGDVLIRVRVQPRASSNAVRLDEAGRLRIALAAPPVDGLANKALRVYLAKLLGCSKSALTLSAGEKSRDKTLTLTGMTADAVRVKLSAAACEDRDAPGKH